MPFYFLIQFHSPVWIRRQRYNNFQLKVRLLAALVQSGNFETANPYALAVCSFITHIENNVKIQILITILDDNCGDSIQMIRKPFFERRTGKCVCELLSKLLKVLQDKQPKSNSKYLTTQTRISQLLTKYLVAC